MQVKLRLFGFALKPDLTILAAQIEIPMDRVLSLNHWHDLSHGTPLSE